MRWVVLGSSLLLAAAAAPALAQSVSANMLQLHDDLHLSPDQEVAWRDYTTAIQPPADMEARRRATEDLLPMVPTPRRIALLQANMEQDQELMKRQGAAVVAFYEKLTPSQQRTFDEETLPSQGGPQQGAAPQSGPPAGRAPSSPRVVTPPASATP